MAVSITSTIQQTEMIPIEVTHKCWGWEGSLERFNKERNDVTLPAKRRYLADKARKKIMAKMEDKKLMAMRERLIKASKAGDERAVIQITKEIRWYSGEDTETGMYES